MPDNCGTLFLCVVVLWTFAVCGNKALLFPTLATVGGTARNGVATGDNGEARCTHARATTFFMSEMEGGAGARHEVYQKFHGQSQTVEAAWFVELL